MAVEGQPSGCSRWTGRTDGLHPGEERGEEKALRLSWKGKGIVSCNNRSLMPLKLGIKREPQREHQVVPGKARLRFSGQRDLSSGGASWSRAVGGRAHVAHRPVEGKVSS